MHATITTMRFPTAAARDEALDQLAPLVRAAGARSGVVVACVVGTGDDELTLFTTYTDERAAESVSGELRPALSAAIGPLVLGPPERRAGPVVALAPQLGISARRQ